MKTLIYRYADVLLLTFLIVIGGGAGFGAGFMVAEFTGEGQLGEAVPFPAVGLYGGAIGAVCAYYVCMAAAKKIKSVNSEMGEEADFDETLPPSDGL